MEILTRGQILENRKKVIEFLKDPKRKKAREMLDKGDGRRCCLGHMCFALKIERYRSYGDAYSYGAFMETGTAPSELVELVGLWDCDGGSKEGYWTLRNRVNCSTLTSLNDDTKASPQEIGAYLETVIEGGEDTPFRPLADYPEEVQHEHSPS